MDAIQVLHNNRKANVIKDHARLRLVPNIKGIHYCSLYGKGTL